VAHIAYTTYRHHALTDEEFKAELQIALEQYDDHLEAELHRRGVVGWEEPVFGSGGPGVGTVQVGTIRKFSDACLFGRLKARMPAKYKEHYQVTQSNNQQKIVVNWNEFLRLSQQPSNGQPAEPDQLIKTEKLLTDEPNGQANGSR
jgi:hypothetical protein